MEWQDTGIVVNVNCCSDSLIIVSCITSKHGLSKGAIKNTKKNRSTLAIGNIISVSWRGRLEDHLGKFNVLSHEPIYPFIYVDRVRMLAVMGMCELFYITLPEKEKHEVLYNYLEDFLYSVKYNENDWLKRMLFVELELLSHIGFGLDLSKCTVTGNEEDLLYISPKSGKAVSGVVGKPYEDKLLPFPTLLKDFDSDVSEAEIHKAMEVIRFFLSKNYEMPDSRLRLEEILKKRLDKVES